MCQAQGRQDVRGASIPIFPLPCLQGPLEGREGAGAASSVPSPRKAGRERCFIFPIFPLPCLQGQLQGREQGARAAPSVLGLRKAGRA